MVEEKIINIRGINYIVSSDGKVFSANTGGASYYHKEIAQRFTKDGYLQITVGKTGDRHQYRVHRMIAEAFIPNPDNLPEINHKDCDRTNNCADNLEWCTHQYNVRYAIDSGNHICTTDLTGSNNPNYKNDTLKKKYRDNPELAKINNSRPGVQNGRCRPVKLINVDNDEEIYFNYTREASKYLMDNKFTKAKDIDTVSNRIALSIKADKVFYGKFKAEFTD